MKKLLIAIGVVAHIGVQTATATSVVGSKHDLSAAGTYKVLNNEVCVACHIPHNARPAAPLWNHTFSAATYTFYTSPTMDAPAPTSASLDNYTKMCLGCHDGTVALGSLVNTVGQVTNATLVLAGPALLGTNLTNDHPVGVLYSAAGPGLKAEPTTGAVKTYSGYVSCASCHNPHDSQFGYFLAATNAGSAICTTCHNK